MSSIGHNGGPTMQKGRGWRRYAWTRARAELLPRMPIEVVRRRVKRARELGLDYKAYAGIRAATGRDVVALLFSDNALRLMADARMPADRAAHLDAVRGAERLALVHAPQDPGVVRMQNPTFARFIDKLLVVAGVLERQGEQAEQPLEITSPRELCTRSIQLADGLVQKSLMVFFLPSDFPSALTMAGVFPFHW